ncbi:MAG: polysaccharide biosynthesis protein [Christensenellales bacterium]|jgi:FlaA1/EpsC-like NDP-sugar epimerase
MSKRKLLLRIIDMGIVLLTYMGLTILLSIKNLNQIRLFEMLQIAGILIVIYYITFELFRVYKTIWRYAVHKEYLKFVIACAVAGGIVTMLSLLIVEFQNSLTVFLVCSSANTIILICLRLFYNIRAINSREILSESDNRTLIIGGGWTAKNILPELKAKKSKYYPIGFIDDNKDMVNRSINGIPVLGTTDDIIKITKLYNVKTILFAIPSIDEENRKRILNICFKTNCELKSLPYINEILSGTKLYNIIQDVKIEDLLGREPMTFENQEVYEYIKNKVCLVTGGGGSIGSELCRQIIKYSPKQLLIIDNYENNAYDIQQELYNKYGRDINLAVEIFSVADRDRLEIFFQRYRPEIVFHAAAHKHVPFMEITPEEAVKNNVVGTLNTAEISAKYEVKKFIMISTDKAVRPTNIMGATKRICEKIIRMVSAENEGGTEFAAVRFGNVLGSNGSVIPLFRKQILNGGPVTVTDKNIIRYFMTIPEAVSLVMQAGALARRGEVFVLDMGEPVKILDLAEKIIKLSGYEPYKDIKIEFTGLRPGEKLYEELLLSSEGIKTTQNKKIFIGTQKDFDITAYRENLEKLIQSARDNDVDKVIDMIKVMVTSFNHQPNNFSRS